METINNITEFLPSDEFQKEINILLEKSNDIFDLLPMYRMGSKQWYKIYENIREIFTKYYYVNGDNFDIEFQRNGRGGGYCVLNDEYKEKIISDVHCIWVKSAYPQRIHKLFLGGMESNDKYLPYIFHFMYKYVEKGATRNTFVNYLYGLLISEKSDIIVDRDITIEVSNYYNDIMSSIKSYYYIDTDVIYLHKDNVEEVCEILDKEDIKYEVENENDFVFFRKKKYINGKDLKLKGFRIN